MEEVIVLLTCIVKKMLRRTQAEAQVEVTNINRHCNIIDGTFE
jgi:hypothetical protein